MNHNRMTDDGIRRLCCAVLIESIKLYRAALRSGSIHSIQANEHFFTSDYGRMWISGSGLSMSGEDIITEIRRQERDHKRSTER